MDLTLPAGCISQMPISPMKPSLGQVDLGSAQKATRD